MTTPTPLPEAEIPEDVAIAAEQAFEAILSEAYKEEGFSGHYRLIGKKARDVIAKAILAERQRSQWQDISTAPKDGTKMLMRGGVYHGFPFVGFWAPSPYAQDRPWETVIGRSNLYEHAPTHWMPLPAPPKGTDHE